MPALPVKCSGPDPELTNPKISPPAPHVWTGQVFACWIWNKRFYWISPVNWSSGEVNLVFERVKTWEVKLLIVCKVERGLPGPLTPAQQNYCKANLNRGGASQAAVSRPGRTAGRERVKVEEWLLAAGWCEGRWLSPGTQSPATNLVTSCKLHQLLLP